MSWKGSYRGVDFSSDGYDYKSSEGEICGNSYNEFRNAVDNQIEQKHNESKQFVAEFLASNPTQQDLDDLLAKVKSNP